MQKETQSIDWKKSLPLLLTGGIVAVGIVIASLIFANVLADRPMTGSFSGSLATGSYSYPELMELETLKDYLGIFPSSDLLDRENGQSYEQAEAKLLQELESNILSGHWPGFPYVKLDGRVYFSKQAVDQWFLQQAQAQLTVG
ncbi:hypothetical protein U6B65_12100 [Oscillospiraceae bacterium MB08-C2-2]|nr:hypothetical protein U6B65_12100 [Oscillospiraceae bacterium MB08-C2-2]